MEPEGVSRTAKRGKKMEGSWERVRTEEIRSRQ